MRTARHITVIGMLLVVTSLASANVGPSPSGRRKALLQRPVFFRAPTISGVIPSSGTQGETLNVNIHGSGFVPGATVDIGPGITVNSAVVHSVGPAGARIGPQLDHLLQVNITIASDAPATTRNVVVTNPDTQSVTRPNAFTVIAAEVVPQLATFELSATNVKGGTVLTGNVTLTEPAGRRGARVTFKSNKRGFAPPAAKVIRRNLTTLPRPLTYRTKRVRTTTTYTVTASYGGVSIPIELTLTP